MSDTPAIPRGRRARRHARWPRTPLAVLAAAAAFAVVPAQAGASGGAFLESLHAVSAIGSTVPPNGDVNPYGVVTVPHTIGSLMRGDTLVSNFNDAANLQGTGSTIVEIAPGGGLTVFAHLEASALPGPCPGGIGLTTALGILPHGYVVVGSLPTEDGQASTAKAGCLIVLDPRGRPVETISGGPVDGPWDLTVASFGDVSALFVTNVLNGTVAGGETPTNGGTVARILLLALPGRAPRVLSDRVIAAGFPERTDPAALVVGPTGVGLGHYDVLYVADTLGNRIAAIPGALFRNAAAPIEARTVSAGGKLNGPLGLAIAPNGDVLTTNAGDGEIVETAPSGGQVASFDTGAGAGGLFGLAVAPGGTGLLFVNDAENTLDLLG
jgi:hypothetical protein